MKKYIATLLLFFVTFFYSQSQNVQVLYDFGKDKNHVTTTFEHFNVDKWGTNFYFVDVEFNGVKNNVSLAYIKAMRTLKFWDSPFSIHLGYDGGLLHTEHFSTYINNAYMIGGDYTYMSKDYSKTLSLKAMYKNIQGIDNATYQLSAIWVLNYFNDKLTVSGFTHYWKENSTHIVYSEPQFWYNATKHLSIGGEIKVGYNFNESGWRVTPSTGIKWNL